MIDVEIERALLVCYGSVMVIGWWLDGNCMGLKMGCMVGCMIERDKGFAMNHSMSTHTLTT